MSHRYYHLWGEITSFANLLLAFRKASLGKRRKATVAAFEYHLEENLFQLQEELRSGAYRPGPYSSFRSVSQEGCDYGADVSRMQPRQRG
jgi:retron-type reverse transcriptase